MLSDSDILRYYKDPLFPGSFSGVRVFQMFLKTDLNEDISEKRIFKLLKQDSNYLLHQRRKRNYPTRSYDVQSFGEARLIYYFKILFSSGLRYSTFSIDHPIPTHCK